MLMKLSDNLRHWKPSAKALAPIDAIRAAWSAIVGIEVAKHCMPSEVRGELLVVLTRSGTWSQQLGFLEANILTAIAQLPQKTAIRELKFRVGKVAQQQRARAAKFPGTQQALRLATELPEATLDEMVARAKAQALRMQRLRGPRCSCCSLSLASGNLCAPCRARQGEERMYSAMRALAEAPWLGDDELRRTVPRLDDEEITAARRILLNRWKRELDRLERKKTFSRGEPERATAVAYVLLATRLTPDQLSRAIMKYELGPRLDTLLYGAAE